MKTKYELLERLFAIIKTQDDLDALEELLAVKATEISIRKYHQASYNTRNTEEELA